MEQPEATAPMDRGGIRFCPDALIELDGGRPVLRISRVDIRHISLRWGRHAARPLAQALLGSGFLAAGLYLLVRIILELATRGGEVYIEVLTGLVILGTMGGWLLWNSWVRGYYLEVLTSERKEKLRFTRGLPQTEISEFLTQAQAQFGYSIELPPM